MNCFVFVFEDSYLVDLVIDESGIRYLSEPVLLFHVQKKDILDSEFYDFTFYKEIRSPLDSCSHQYCCLYFVCCSKKSEVFFR